jgi:hypothetical protein
MLRFLCRAVLVALLMSGLSGCNLPAPTWAIELSDDGTLTAQALCGRVVGELGVIRRTGGAEVRDEDYIWRASARSPQDAQTALELFVPNEHYLISPIDAPTPLPTAYTVISNSSYVDIDQSTPSPAILWDGKVYQADQMNVVESEFSRITYGRTGCQ